MPKLAELCVCRSVSAPLLMLVLVLTCLSVRAQSDRAEPTTNPASRPKIGLVLSGGGARGFAHIGALEVLEAHHIPVDYVAGASMGAMIGAMYATGMTPAEMRELVSTLNWDQLLRGSPPYEELSFRRREDRRNIPAALLLRGRPNEMRLPASFNSGHELGLLLDRLMLPYATVTDFDELPIPFRAVATDMIEGKTVILGSGSLARALRATMAVPGVLTPVEIGGKLLSDGGILNNIPTDVVKAMGADIIIVINIETPLNQRGALEDIAGVLGQTILVTTVENSRRSLRQADFIIAPDLEKFGLADFQASSELIELGRRGAEQKAFLLQSLALDDIAWQRHQAVRRRRERPRALPVPAFVQVLGDDARAARVVAQKLAGKYAGVTLDPAQLEDDLTHLTGTGRFDNLGYGLTRRQGATGLLIHVYDPVERTDKPTTLELGFEVNNAEADRVNFNARARLTLFDVGRYGAEWRSDLRLGSTTLLATEYFFPLGNTKWFLAPSAAYERQRLSLYQNETRLAEYLQATAQGRLDLGYSFNKKSEVRAGYITGHVSGARRIGAPLLLDLRGGFNAASVRWVYDSVDSVQVPTHGVEVRSAFNYYFDSPGAPSGFPQLESSVNAYYPLGERTIGFVIGAGGTTFGDTAPPFQQFDLGGLFRLGGYGRGEFRGSHYLRGGAGWWHEIFALPAVLGGEFYLGGWYEGGSAFERLSAANYRQSVTVGARLKTRFGPVFIGGSRAEGGRGKVYFSLGRAF